MRDIKITKRWKETGPDGKEIDVGLIEGLNALISLTKPEDMLRGLDKARMFNRLIKAFDKANETNELILEESDFSFLKKSIEDGVPAEWGRNPDMMGEIEVFLKAESDTEKNK